MSPTAGAATNAASGAAPARKRASADAIDELLPQTQCTRCGYQGCKPYAEAIASGTAEINQCPPGGTATIHALAGLTGRAPLPLNPANGVEGSELVAQIDEDRCIGCAKCLAPCPVDAILGMRRQMHTVIAELCTAPCPVDCIVMTPRASLPVRYAAPTPAANRARFEAHNARIAHRARTSAELLAERKQAAHADAC